MTAKKSDTKKKKSEAKKKVPKAAAPKPQPAPAPAQPKKEPQKPLACLIGDAGLVAEYSAVMQSHGVPVMELRSLASLKSSAKKVTIAFELTLADGPGKRSNLKELDAALAPEVPVVTNAVTATVLAQAVGLKHPGRLIGIAAFPTLIANRLVELAPSLHTTQGTAETVTAFFASLKKERTLSEDAVGMVMPRILCQMINEACYALQNDTASPKDIDTAMKAGAHHPHGPIEWGESIGFRSVLAVLDALHAWHRDERYSAAPLLRKLAEAGTFWTVKDA